MLKPNCLYRVYHKIKEPTLFLIFTGLLYSCSGGSHESSLQIPGLQEEVEILIDSAGISHIYAKNEQDLFFTQGYNAARDRLFQLEIWRRQATGTVAEILGAGELQRDIGTRLFMYRGDMETELAHYHPRSKEIIQAFVQGVNAYISKTEKEPSLLPPEFGMLGIKPGSWTTEVVISRHQGLLGNIGQELNLGRAVAKLGENQVLDLSNFTPSNPNLKLDASITSEMLEKDILGLYNAFRRRVRFNQDQRLAFQTPGPTEVFTDETEYIGSNNWIVDGSKSASGFPMMANDPHRTQAIPSLRYWAHLVAPGWNVIGGGEPEIPGISIGHNGFGAWGLTVFRTDGEDLYVYDLNPENLNQYRYKGNWEEMTVIREEIPVKNQDNVQVDLRYTRHGPITFIDSVLNKGYAVRCAWLEPGGSPYLASLRMDQSKSWQEFREACNYSNIPGENMIWADKEGTIGWQAVGIAPIRPNWSGLVPIPGDGSYEWDGYLPIREKPHLVNPGNGVFASSNEYLVPPDYPHMNAIGYSWSDPFRGNRSRSVLEADINLTISKMADLQTDYFSIPASRLVPLLMSLAMDERSGEFKDRLKHWNYSLDPDGIEASIYITWERQVRDSIVSLVVPKEAKAYFRSLSMVKILDILEKPSPVFGAAAAVGRDNFLKSTFNEAIENLIENFGEDTTNWVYGQDGFKHIELKHALDPMLTEAEKEIFNTKSMPRGGNSFTLNNTSGGNNQTHGASFRIIVDTGDFDKTLGCNSPGQSGDPRDQHYKDLYPVWAADKYFPVFYSRENIEKYLDRKIILKPAN